MMFGANSKLNVTQAQFAVKTGTTTSEKDNWAIGYNNDFVVITWIGNNNGDPTHGVSSGYRGASSIWRDTVDYLIANRNVTTEITKPSNLIEAEICTLTGTLSCNGCPTIKQLFVKGEEPQQHCTEEEIDRILGVEDEEDTEATED